MSYNEEIEIIEKLRQGNEETFRLIIKKNKTNMFRLAYGILQDKAKANDAVQEAFISLWENKESFEYKAKLSTWLYRTTYNKAINLQRREKIWSFFSKLKLNSDQNSEDKELNFEDNVPFDNNLDDGIDSFYLKNSLKQALDSLPKNQKIAFVLSKYENLSTKEIAEIMDMTAGAVDALIFRAKQNLQKKLIKVYKNYKNEK